MKSLIASVFFISAIAFLFNSNTTIASNPAVKPATTEVATLAGGCFWKMDAAYQQLKGVKKVQVGYAGGKTKNPTYKEVCTRTTGHAETIEVTFDPSVISYREILEVFWEIHDATVLNREGNDIGDDYRSAVFYHSENQKKEAEKLLAEHNKSLKYGKKLVTTVEAFRNFYPAEDYHQNYYNQHPNEPYTYGVVRKKVEHFQKVFKDKLKAKS